MNERQLRVMVDRDQTARRDTVDGAADHQLNLSWAELSSIISPASLTRLQEVAKEFAAARTGQKGDMRGLGAGRVFVRRYSARTRPWIPFHCDSAAITVNVALASDPHDRHARAVAAGDRAIGRREGERNEGEGDEGKLLVLCDGAVRCLHPRLEGEATVHDSSLLHAVSRVLGSRVRYSLIIFYDLV